MSRIIYRRDHFTDFGGTHQFTAAVDTDTRVISVAALSRNDIFKKKIGNDIAVNRMIQPRKNDVMIIMPSLFDRCSRDEMIGFVSGLVDELMERRR